jgi:ribosomal protein L6P/L9E
MSRIGKLPINIPEKVEANARSQILLLKFGTLQTKVPDVILLLKMVVS